MFLFKILYYSQLWDEFVPANAVCPSGLSVVATSKLSK